MRIVRPKISDIKAIQGLIAESFEISETFAKQVYSEDKLKNIFSKRLSFMLVEKNNILGVIAGSPDTENPISLWIDLLFVNAKMQRKGLGTKIMKFYEDYLYSRGFGQIVLFTEIINPQSRKFYERIGYKQVGDLDFLPGLHRVFYKKIINNKVVAKEYNKYKRFL